MRELFAIALLGALAGGGVAFVSLESPTAAQCPGVTVGQHQGVSPVPDSGANL